MYKIIDIQTLIKAIKALKMNGLIYNEADLCQKSGVPQSYLSDMKAGRRPISDEMVQRIEKTFPEFFGVEIQMKEPDEPTLGEVARMIADHDRRFHDQMERIMDAMGIAPKKVASL